MNENVDNDASDGSRRRGFRPMGARVPTPLFRRRPGQDERYVLFEHDDSFACFVGTAVLPRVREWAMENRGAEKIGRLWGRQCAAHSASDENSRPRSRRRENSQTA